MKLRFTVPFDEEPEQPIDLAAYALDRSGAVVASAPIRDGAFELTVDAARAADLSVAIAPVRPDLEQRAPSSGHLARLRAYEPVVRIDPKAKVQTLKPIPKELSRFWWLCSCRVRGQVVKPVGDPGPVVVNYPVCHARVHICEVDPIWLLLDVLPDPWVLRLRDELLVALERPPTGPTPDPGPIDVRLPTTAPSEPRGARLGPEPDFLSAALGGPAAISRAAVLSVPASVALASSSVSDVRNGLRANVELIRPFICWWPWLWRWFWRCDEVSVVETDENGRFDVTMWHPCDDQPDLYFWVEYFINGVWTTVYGSGVPCGTYWDFDCSSEVTLRITDPRVPYCGGHDSLAGKNVVVKTIGNNVSMSVILGAAAGVREGIVPDAVSVGSDSPFAGTLEMRTDFGDALIAAGVVRYKWSYRQLTDATGTPLAVADVPHKMAHEVVRHYRTVDGGGNPVDLPHRLGPDADGLFDVFNPDVSVTPAGNHNWPVDDAHVDLVSGFFEPLPLAVGAVDDTHAGKYELTLELFHADGSVVDWTAEGIGLSEPNVPAPFGAAPMTTVASPNEHRILSGAGHTLGFRLVIHVDNSHCGAEILDVTAPTPSGPCGFIDYPLGATAHVSFQARHVHDFAVFDFVIDKGSSGTVVPGSVSARVGDTAVNGFVRDAVWVFAKDVAITGPGSLVDSPSPCPDGRAAFAETLSVTATAIDGWSPASWLNAPATPKAFALNPKPGP